MYQGGLRNIRLASRLLQTNTSAVCMLPAACFVLSINSCSNCYFQVYLHTNQRYMNQNQILRKHLFKKQPAIQKSLMTLAQEATI